MKIIIQSHEIKRITLFFPTRLICSRLIWKMILNHIDEMHHFQDFDIWIKPIYQYLRSYVKQNGHFTLMKAKMISGYCILIQI